MDQAAAGIGQGQAAGGALAIHGTLRISVSEGFGSWFLARQVPEFAEAHPALTLDLVASSGFLSLSKREADIAVTLSRPKAGPMVARKLSDYALRLYASRAYLDHHGQPRAPGDLAQGHRLIGYIPDLLCAGAALSGRDLPRPCAHAALLQHQRPAPAAGRRAGIGARPPCFIGDADAGLVPVLPERRVTRTFWLVTHKDTHQLARVRAGKDWIWEPSSAGGRCCCRIEGLAPARTSSFCLFAGSGEVACCWLGRQDDLAALGRLRFAPARTLIFLLVRRFVRALRAGWGGRLRVI